MPKVGMEPIRREQLIGATIRCIHEEGFVRTTLIRASRRAGLSPGMVTHYFVDKPGLLAATLGALNREIGESVLKRLKSATGPAERIHAIVGAQFEDDQFAPEKTSAWLALTSNVRENEMLGRLNLIYERRLRSNLVYSLKTLAPGKNVDDVALGISAVVTGLWIKAAGSTSPLTASKARQLMHEYVDMQIAKLNGSGRNDRPG